MVSDWGFLARFYVKKEVVCTELTQLIYGTYLTAIVMALHRLGVIRRIHLNRYLDLSPELLSPDLITPTKVDIL
jgi:hypothetical protein